MLEHLKELTTLYVGSNKLAEASAIRSLEQCANLTTLDLSNNKLGQSSEMILILERIPDLRVLYLRGNPVVRDIDPYRIRLTLHCVSKRRNLLLLLDYIISRLITTFRNS